MLQSKEALLERLDAIGAALSRTPRALALIGLGSVGRELDRLDEFSDLDFFVIVEPGTRLSFIENLAWLESAAPVAYCFRNTADGYKLLFADGIFCEFAVFEPDALAGLDFAPGRLVWQAAGFDETLAVPRQPAQAAPQQETGWLVGEALTNLYVGMCRYRRGEKLSAQRFIQGYAVDRVVELAAQVYPAAGGPPDPFTGERRFEQRFPELAAALPDFIPGYAHTPQAALAILQFLAEHFEVNGTLKRLVEELCAAEAPGKGEPE